MLDIGIDMNSFLIELFDDIIKILTPLIPIESHKL